MCLCALKLYPIMRYTLRGETRPCVVLVLRISSSSCPLTPSPTHHSPNPIMSYLPHPLTPSHLTSFTPSPPHPSCHYCFPSITSLSHSIPSLPLEGMKRKIMRNLRTLEQEGMVNSKNDYQEIINAIARVSVCVCVCVCMCVHVCARACMNLMYLSLPNRTFVTSTATVSSGNRN